MVGRKGGVKEKKGKKGKKGKKEKKKKGLPTYTRPWSFAKDRSHAKFFNFCFKFLFKIFRAPKKQKQNQTPPFKSRDFLISGLEPPFKARDPPSE